MANSLDARAEAPPPNMRSPLPAKSWPVILGAGIMFAVAMGVGRFAYTPMLPQMHAYAGLDYANAGTLASTNSCGYLLGALLSTMRWARHARYRVLAWSLLAIILATALMAAPSIVAWEASRLVTGIAGGFAFVLTSTFLLERSASDARLSWLPWGGVGLGIAAAGVLVPAFTAFGSWRFGWLGLAIISAVVAIPVLRTFRPDGVMPGHPPTALSATRTATSRSAFYWLLLAYGLEGLGYIIPATFMVAIVHDDPAVSRFANLAWVIVGLIAAPSMYFWSRVRERTGAPFALALAFLIQAGGVFVSATVHSTFAVVCAAATLGGTFLGISAIGLGLGRHLSPPGSHTSAGLLTTVFGAGQILGPLAATALMTRSGDYRPGLIFATAVIGFCAIIAGGMAYRLRPAAAR